MRRCNNRPRCSAVLQQAQDSSKQRGGVDAEKSELLSHRRRVNTLQMYHYTTEQCGSTDCADEQQQWKQQKKKFARRSEPLHAESCFDWINTRPGTKVWLLLFSWSTLIRAIQLFESNKSENKQMKLRMDDGVVFVWEYDRQLKTKHMQVFSTQATYVWNQWMEILTAV